jgi:membrane-associated phospholipid phosphatase
VLFALAFARVSRKLGWFFAVYAIVILVGSVHLGWHYAVDGYAGIFIAGFSWWLAGIVARWVAARPVTQRYNEGLASL